MKLLIAGYVVRLATTRAANNVLAEVKACLFIRRGSRPQVTPSHRL